MPIADRREFLGYFSSIGLGSTLLPGVLWERLRSGAEITADSIASAAEIAGVELDEEEREMMVQALQGQARQLAALHEIPLHHQVAPAIVFNPLPRGFQPPLDNRPFRPSRPEAGSAAPDDETLAFMPVHRLAGLVRSGAVTSERLTRLSLERIARLDPKLHAVITVLEERALSQARAADREIAAGRYRGPLHGIPWGAKDLLGVAGAPTTWGAAPYREQLMDTATVVRRLDEAGAVLVAKLTLGELAMGDTWFGGMTRNPWNLEQGSSGSSAGSAAATAAGLVWFSLGSETLGSISSPSTRCGTTGLRPTFGRVPRTGAMPLSWSMDKIGPICRSVEDCALVLEAIRGPDGQDMSVHTAGFGWDVGQDVRRLRVGYFEKLFSTESQQRAFDQATLAALKSLGMDLIPVELPDVPYAAMRIILRAEAAASFDELTRSGRDAELAQQGPDAWPNTFRTARFIPAVDYVNANRVRSMAIERWADLFEEVDVIVAPTNSAQLLATNLTGHPAVMLPNGFRENGTPVSITFLGDLFEEANMLAVARAYQEATDFHLKRPTLG
jgi:Asp-tRNA(Asn)/Glu-tRNA(Gln) amidotransferase A subunit family amidase